MCCKLLLLIIYYECALRDAELLVTSARSEEKTVGIAPGKKPSLIYIDVGRVSQLVR